METGDPLIARENIETLLENYSLSVFSCRSLTLPMLEKFIQLSNKPFIIVLLVA
jgi:hypothetical protein